MKISVIISNYNTEKYISKAIQSVLDQTYDNVEIVVVDDCSTDNSIEVIKQYPVKLIQNTENVGCGMSRRNGILEATGDYLMFLDSDDYFGNNEYFQLLINEIKATNPDMINSGFTYIDPNGNILQERKPDYLVQEGTNKFIPDPTDTKRFIHGNIFKMDLFKKVEYSGRRFIEDTPTLFKLLYFSKKVVTVPYADYIYLKRDGSLIQSSNIVKNKIYNILASKDICSFLQEQNENDSIELFTNKLSENIDILSSEEASQYKDELVEIFQFYLKNV